MVWNFKCISTYKLIILRVLSIILRVSLISLKLYLCIFQKIMFEFVQNKVQINKHYKYSLLVTRNNTKLYEMVHFFKRMSLLISHER